MFEWLDPEPLESSLPDLKVEQIPESLRFICEPISLSTQTPIELSFLTSVSVIAGATRGKVSVRVTSDYAESLSLYSAVILGSGNRKSSVVSKLAKPLREIESEFEKLEQIEFSERKEMQRIKQKQLQNLKAENKSENDLRAEVSQLTLEISNLEPNPITKIWIDDVTPEALVQGLAEQGSLTLIDDEGGFFENLYRYQESGEVNQKAILKAHTAESIRVDRKGSDSITCKNPHLVLSIAAQPNAITPLQTNQALRERGLPQRFIFLKPKSLIGNRSAFGQQLSNSVLTDWNSKIRNLFEVCRLIESREIQIKNSDLPKYEELFDYLEGLQSGESESMIGWLSKLQGNLIRLAAIISLFENPKAIEVDSKILQKCFDLAPVLIEHAQSILNPSDQHSPAFAVLQKAISIKSDLSDEQKFEIQRIEGFEGFEGVNPENCRSLRNLHQQLKDQKQFAGKGGAGKVRGAIHGLCEKNWFRSLEMPSSAGRPSEIFELNPKYLTEFERQFGKF